MESPRESTMTNVDIEMDDATLSKMRLTEAENLKHWTCGPVSFAMSKKCRIISVLLLSIAIIFMPIFFLVIVPIIVQNIVDKTDITVYHAVIANPTNTSFQASVVENIDANTPFDSKVSLNSVILQWNHESTGGKLAKLKAPSTLDVGKKEVTMRSPAKVKDVSAMTNFNLYAMDAEYVDWHIKGDGELTTLGMVFDVFVDCKVKLRGFDGFPVNPVIDQLNTTGGSATTLYAFIIANFTSVSNIEIDFGQDLSFFLTSDGINIGTGTIPHCTLRSGSHKYLATVEMTPTTPQQVDQLNRVISN
jgi:hypothetical protein